MQITAALAREGQEPFSLETLELEEPRADEILVRIAGVGICHTDMVFKEGGRMVLPAVLGHEGAGVVERVGSAVTKVKPGDRVVLTFRSCGQCRLCQRQEPAYCYSARDLNFKGKRPDGSRTLSLACEEVSGNFFGQSSFASHCLAYESNVVKVPETFPLELAGPLGCGVQTGAGGVMNSLHCEAGSSLLVLGGGAVGLSAVMAAAIRECDPIIVVEPHAARRALALELGATHVIDPMAQKDLVEAVRSILPGGVEYAFDTAGRPALLEEVMKCLAPRGVFGIVGIAPPGTQVPGVLTGLVAQGLTVRGIIEGDSDPDRFIPEMMELHRQGRFPVEKLVKTYGLGEINRAVAEHSAGKCVKAVLIP